MKVDVASVEDFIRTKRAQGWNDREMAVLLNVGVSTVAHWRNRFRIKPAEKFRRNFDKKYAEKGGIEHFCLMVEVGVTLKKIGDYFGFGREYARQVHNKLYDRGRLAK